MQKYFKKNPLAKRFARRKYTCEKILVELKNNNINVEENDKSKKLHGNGVNGNI